MLIYRYAMHSLTDCLPIQQKYLYIYKYTIAHISARAHTHTHIYLEREGAREKDRQIDR